MVKYLRTKDVEKYVLNQVGKAGTSIGANISESRCAQSRADFVSKLKISLKEADETKFWLAQLHNTETLTDTEYDSINNDLMEIIYLLNSIINKTIKNGM